jgi:sulfonate transport system permease protein
MSDAASTEWRARRRIMSLAWPAGRLAGGTALTAAVIPLALLAGWQGASQLKLISADLLPSPAAVGQALIAMAVSGEMTTHVAATARRVALGFAVGSAAGTALGALTGVSGTARRFIDPTVQALRSVPSIAWVPLFILWFGIFEASKVALIATGVFFPVYLNLSMGVRNVDRRLIEVGLVNNLTPLALVARILGPAAAPAYFTGLRTGLAIGWMFVIAAELMGASKGLGFLMLDSEMTGRPSVILGALILFALLGKASDAILVVLERYFLAWSDDLSRLQTRDRA